MAGKLCSVRQRVFLMGSILVLSLFVLSMILLPAQADARNIKVGIIDCYSGPAAVFGNDALNGFKLALKEINKKGVLGKKIEFTTRDTKFKVDIALNMAKELVMRENVDVLVGTINSGAALAVSDAVAKKERCHLWFGSRKARELLVKRGIVMSFQPVKIRPWREKPGVLPCPKSLM